MIATTGRGVSSQNNVYLCDLIARYFLALCYLLNLSRLCLCRKFIDEKYRHVDGSLNFLETRTLTALESCGKERDNSLFQSIIHRASYRFDKIKKMNKILI